MLEIITLKEKHLEDAALLVCNRYQRLCEQESHVPDRYLGVNNLLFLLQNLLKETETGVAAIHGDRLIGFMVGWAMPSWCRSETHTVPNRQMKGRIS